MWLCYGILKRVIPRICLLVGLVLLLCRVDGKPIASSTDSPALNEISDEVTPAASELQPSTDSTEAGLSNEVLPTEALVSATLRVPKLPPASSTTERVPEFNRNQVSLVLPDNLFSSTANLTLQLRSFIGDFITTTHGKPALTDVHPQRTSVRIAQVVRFFQPLFGYHLMIDIPKEMDV
uniref:Uncharacterized protein n=1 Tax=Anopheles atroparvus TaxID=41427 RepID=A0A182JFW8_ANOAO